MWPNGSVQCENASSFEEIIQNCRLGQLNFDCLEKIFENLCSGELIKLCKINPIVCDAIIERAVSKRMICFDDWNQIWSTEQIFKEIGGRIKSMSIGQQNICQRLSKWSSPFDHFMSLLVKHCKRNQIHAMSLHFDIHNINLDLLEASKPFWTNVRQLHFAASMHHGQPNVGYEQFLAAIIETATQLSTIQLENTGINGHWLQYHNMRNIQHLALINTSIYDLKNWQCYFAQQPTLSTFAWIHAAIPNYTLCENIARYCKQLEHFIDIQHHVPLKYLQQDFVMNRYNYFALFDNLKCARITAYTSSGRDLIGVFLALAQKCTVQTLSINFIANPLNQFNVNNRLDIRIQYAQFTSVKCLEIGNHSTCHFWNETIVNFMSSMVNLNEVTISGHEPINSVQMTCIALAAPKLKTLNIHQTNIQSSHLSRALTTIARVRRDNSMLNVVVNPHQKSQLEGQQFGDIQIIEEL